MLNSTESIALEASSEKQSLILAEQTRFLYGALNSALLTTVINAVLLVFVMWSVVDHTSLLVWLGVLLTLTTIRWIIARRFRQSQFSLQTCRLWYFRFAVGALTAAGVWGSAAVFVYPQQDFGYQLFLIFVLGSMAAGSMISLGHDRRIATAFLTLLMGPLIVRVYFSQSEFNLVMALLLLFYLVLFIALTRRIAKTVEKNVTYEMKLKWREREQLQQKQKFQVLLDSVSDAFFLHDLEGRFVEVNDHACESVGYTRQELLSMTVSDIEKAADPKMLKSLWPTLQSAGKIEVECLHRRKDGSTFEVEVYLGPVELGENRYISAFARDISAHKKALADSNRAKIEAQRLNMAKSEFLSRMSHELRTPLNAILGFSQILQLQSDNLTQVQRDNVDEIYKAGNYLLELIEDLLDLSKVELGKLELHMEAVDITSVLKDCLCLVEAQAQTAQVELIGRICPIEYSVWADPLRTKQVVVNLLTNAIKYNSRPGKVFLSSKALPPNRFRVAVKDTGNGIPDEEIERLFKPFERLESNSAIEGTGIGLAITKQLVVSMGGEIGVKSEQGKGCEFWVDFDLHQCEH